MGIFTFFFTCCGMHQKLQSCNVRRCKAQNCHMKCKIRLKKLCISNLFFQTILRILSDHISITEKRKIDFSIVSEHRATFWTKKNWVFLRRVGRGRRGYALTKTGQKNVSIRMYFWKYLKIKLYIYIFFLLTDLNCDVIEFA